MLKRNCSESTKLESKDNSSIDGRKGIQHSIVTTISSSKGGPPNNPCNKVTIETTVSWSKLPSLNPSHPVVEVVSDGTNSPESKSESSDDKENEQPINLKCRPLKLMTEKLQRLGEMYSDDSENIEPVIKRTEERFCSEVPRYDLLERNTKPAGRRARLAALADTINHWEDDPRHFPVGKQLESKSSKQSSVLTKHSVTKDKGNSEHRRFISPQKGGVILNKTTKSPFPERKDNTNLISLKRPIPTTSENTPKAKRTSPINGTKENTTPKPVNLDKNVIDSLEAQGFSRSVSKQRLIYNYDTKKPPSPVKVPSPTKASSPEKLSPPPSKAPSPTKIPSPEKRIPFSILKAQASPKSSPVRANSPSKGRYGSPQMGVAVLRGTSSKVPSSSDEDSCAPVMGVRQLRTHRTAADGGWSHSQSALGHAGAQGRDASPTKQSRIDPAELPLAERMALFERNAGPAVLPRAPLAVGVSSSKLQITSSSSKLQNSSSSSKLQNTSSTNKLQSTSSSSKLQNTSSINKLQSTSSSSKLQNTSSSTEHKPVVHMNQQLKTGSLQDRLALFEKRGQEKSVMKDTSLARQPEFNILRQRWNKNKEVGAPVNKDQKPQAPPSPPPLPSPPQPFEYGGAQGSNRDHWEEDQYDSDLQTASKEAYSDVKEAKKVRFSPTKDGCRYPSLSDDDVESETYDQENSDNNRSSSSNSSKESDVSSSEQETVQLSKTNLKRYWSASESSGAEANEIDDYLLEALDTTSDETSPPKRSSYSTCTREEESRRFIEKYSPSKKEHESSQVVLHTVSFYRKQQNMAMKPITPVRRVELKPNYFEESVDLIDDDEIDKELVQQKIERLDQEVIKQQTYVSQASQALDLCYSSFEFSGSTELLEAEKLLLLASLRKQALLQEMKRLRVEGRLYPGGPSVSERGSLTMSHVSLSVKMDVVHHAAKDDECYYLLCVVRHNEEVQCSDIMSSRRSLHGNKITFPNKFVVKDLSNDFRITVEFYAMKARHKELIPHDIKYHINTNKKEVSKLRLTPRKTKADPRLVAQPSSAGRTSAFTLAGHLALSLRDVHRAQFTLCKSKHVYNNVLEGLLQLRLESEMRVDVEYRGFLTMFEDISGLGAWHRRWCLLKGDKLSYWKYPDDEKKKVPLDTIELSQCTIREVEVVRRDVCARPNTLQLFTVRPARHTDTESLVVTRRGDRTCIRHWLSADTREERDQWCHHLNKALAMMRAWGVSTAL